MIFLQLAPMIDPKEMQTIRHSEDALRTALVSKRQDLMDRYNKYSPGEQRLLEDCLRPDSTLFHPITLHSPSDWIISHPESTQDFEAFYKNPYRKTPNKGRNTVYIQTVGSFGSSEDSTRLYVEWLQEYCEAFYYGLAVRLLEPVSVSETACAFRINENTCNLQVHAGSLLHYLKKRKPKDAFCIVGITMIDLYPEDSWNFVFGQASLTEGMGIFSFARYDDNFYSREYKGRIQKSKKLTPGDYSIFNSYYTPPVTSALLYRSCRTLTHEIGHIFGLKHCQWMQCVMQGSNHLEESDRRPLDLCPICLRKLQSATGFKIAERYKALLRWIESDLTTDTHMEAAKTAQKPTAAFEESRKWLMECLCVIGD
ncbi:archaemetzincin-2 isoform X1 [Erpetoichthys calabaricus]|uniref:archaemetzincin-2 isoform X1 n=1 Tax=Erpetoichthys calabaricus TaxID=27687 RepID=UPI0010A002B9|nr:archaemetzincin-2 isoform X1 [Erpetoichthys calabaricus]XP_051792209.1 archaemetzincin-2 isoform X1 [Erpetoichthys calabaricus]XP_051792210.1 archaemetzincin-2 isoform X1 [Erpetoichthys calabaricus]